MTIYRCDFCGKEFPRESMFYVYLKPQYENKSKIHNEHYRDICNDCIGVIFKKATIEPSEASN